MSKKESVRQNVPPPPVIDEHDHSHPMLPLLLVGVLGLALVALLLRAFGVF